MSFGFIKLEGQDALICTSKSSRMIHLDQFCNVATSQLCTQVKEYYKSDRMLRAIFAVHSPAAQRLFAKWYPDGFLFNCGNVFMGTTLFDPNMIALADFARYQTAIPSEFFDLISPYVQDWSFFFCKAVMEKWSVHAIEYILQNDLYFDVHATHTFYPEFAHDILNIRSGSAAKVSLYGILVSSLQELYVAEPGTYRYEYIKWGKSIWARIQRSRNIRAIASTKVHSRLRQDRCCVHKLPYELIQLVCNML